VSRPTKYSEDILDKTRKYIESDYKLNDGEVPTLEGLAIYLELHRDTIHDWSKHEDKKEFSDTLDGLKAKQAQMVISNGLRGDYNATIAKLLLHNHGYNDKVDNNIGGQDGNPIKVTHIELVPLDDGSSSTDT
jgi:hypothetical protein